MNLKAFCNKCLSTNLDKLSVTSCRHVLCLDCHAKLGGKCGVCGLPCKTMQVGQLPEEMAIYFKPILPTLRKYLKIAQFQLQQRSLWTAKNKHLLDRLHVKRQKAHEKRDKFQHIKEGYKRALQENEDLKKKLKKARSMEPSNPFEFNSNRQQSADHHHERNRHRSHALCAQEPNAAHSFNSMSSSSSLSRSNASSLITGHSPFVGQPNAMSRPMSSTVNTSFFFNGSAISASSSLNSTGNTNSSAGSRTGQVRRLLQSSTIRSPTHNRMNY